MSRFVIEHLPRTPAVYRSVPIDFAGAKEWITRAPVASLVRTTELIGAIEGAMGIELPQSDAPGTLTPGDQAMLISLSYGVLLASTQGDIPPLPEDWRCALLTVEGGGDDAALASMAAEVPDGFSEGEAAGV